MGVRGSRREEVREEAGDAPHDTLAEVCDAAKPEVSPSYIHGECVSVLDLPSYDF
jgi:hypothetical protein